MTAQTDAQRMAEFRKRKLSAGMARIDKWVPADKLQAILDYIAEITGETDK